MGQRIAVFDRLSKPCGIAGGDIAPQHRFMMSGVVKSPKACLHHHRIGAGLASGAGSPRESPNLFTSVFPLALAATWI